jgi:hypothetical protein
MKGSPMLHCIPSKVENQIFMNKNAIERIYGILIKLEVYILQVAM